MAMLDIEYRFSEKPLEGKTRRKTTKDMEFYIRGLVFEMQSADISVKFRTTSISDDEKNMVYVNGRKVPDILNGLDIVIPEPDEETCGCDTPKVIPIGKPSFEWNTENIEDIPDVLMKNAIAKIYAEMESNRIM